MECRIKVGDQVKHCVSNEWEEVKTIIYNDPNDFRSIDGNRVTINGEYWNVDDIKAVKPKNEK